MIGGAIDVKILLKFSLFLITIAIKVNQKLLYGCFQLFDKTLRLNTQNIVSFYNGSEQYNILTFKGNSRWVRAWIRIYGLNRKL